MNFFLILLLIGCAFGIWYVVTAQAKSKAPKSNLSYQPLADAPDFWTEDDSRALTSFFNSETGQKLKLRLTNYVLRSAVAATAKEDNLEYHCGKARGVAEAVQEIEFHLSPAPAHEGINEETEDAASAAFDFSTA